MTIHTTFPVDPRDIRLRDEFRDYIIEIQDDIARITHGLPDETAKEAKDLRWLIKELDKTRLDLLRLEGRLSNEADADPTTTFDFEHARHQIGRRLDRIRESYGPKEVSGST